MQTHHPRVAAQDGEPLTYRGHHVYVTRVVDEGVVERCNCSVRIVPVGNEVARFEVPGPFENEQAAIEVTLQKARELIDTMMTS